MEMHKEILEKAIKNKSFLRKDVLGGMYIDFPNSHGKIVNYAIDNNIQYKQYKSFKNLKTSFVTELIFESEEQTRFFYENMEEILGINPFQLR